MRRAPYSTLVQIPGNVMIGEYRGNPVYAKEIFNKVNIKTSVGCTEVNPGSFVIMIDSKLHAISRKEFEENFERINL